MAVWITFVILLYLCYSSAATTCSNYKECAGKVVTNPICNGLSSCSEASIDTTDSIECSGQTSCYKSASLSSQDRIFCQGYKSCRYSQSMIAQGNIQCNGWCSCDHMKDNNDYTFISSANIQCSGSTSCQYNTMKSNGNTVCDADRSCYQTVIHAGDNIYCDADKSCAKSKLIATNDIHCSSKGSCYGSKIIGTTLNAYGMYAAHKGVISSHTINGFGYYSLSDAVMDSKGIHVMDVNAFGEMSGYGAHIICREGSECTVSCKGTGCNGITFVCLDGAHCNVLPATCDESDNESERCPTMVYTDNDNMGEILNDKSEEQYTVELDDDILYAVHGNIVEMMQVNSMIYMNLLCGFVVFLVTIMMVNCYFRNKYGENK